MVGSQKGRKERQSLELSDEFNRGLLLLRFSKKALISPANGDVFLAQLRILK